MRNTSYHVDIASKEQIIGELKLIKLGKSKLSRKFRDLITERAKKNGWDDSELVASKEQ